jgi:hypothetical protein
MKTPFLAQANIQIGNITGIGPLGSNQTTPMNAFTQFEIVISNIIGLLTLLAGLYFFFQLIIAGYNYISAGGDKGQVQAAQKKITNNFTGLIIVVAAYLITGIIGRFLGIQFLNFSTIINNSLHP